MYYYYLLVYMFSIQRILVHINLYKVYKWGKNDQTSKVACRMNTLWVKLALQPVGLGYLSKPHPQT